MMKTELSEELEEMIFVNVIIKLAISEKNKNRN